MPPMSQSFLPSHILVILIFSLTALANPLRETAGLAERDNKFNLKCGNAPNISAGDYLNSTDVTNPLPHSLPQSGSSERWFQYLWCVPGTRTYLFLNSGRLEPPPLEYRNIHAALVQANLQAQADLRQAGDGPISSRYNGYMTPDFSFYLQPSGSNMIVYAQPFKRILSRGVLVSALTGLTQYVSAGYDVGNMPLVFQINDGWAGGEVGIGYVGFSDANDKDNPCVLENIQGVVTKCQDLPAGKVIQ